MDVSDNDLREDVLRKISTQRLYDELQRRGFVSGAESNPVLQPWVAGLTMMQQTVLLTAIRGPDGLTKYHSTKVLLRWYRRCVLLSAMDKRALDNPYSANGGSFTGPSIATPVDDFERATDAWEPLMDDVVDRYMALLDEVPLHFHKHLLHAAQIVGYKHPDTRIACWWRGVYLRFVHDFHLHVEAEDEMDRRLGDNRDQWLERADRATVA